jgi:hypothetical protein
VPRPLCRPSNQECELKSLYQRIRKSHQKEEFDMSARLILGRRLSRPAAKVLARPRELFGESIPELLLVTAVVAAVVSGLLSLSAG